MNQQTHRRCIRLFAAAVVLIALGGGLSSSIFSNYFREVYQISAQQRGFLEIPRESSGVVCVALFALLGALGNLTLGIASQFLMIAGLLVMGFLSPSYQWMIPFLFLYATGEHLFMPVEDAIALNLAEGGHDGGTLGYFKKYKNLAFMAAGVAVFVGFRAHLFRFDTPIILPFALALVLNAGAAWLLWQLRRELPRSPVKNTRFVLRKAYLPYYLTAFAYGCQKRIRIVFGPWILIELLSRGADLIAILTLLARLVSSIVAPWLGRLLDRHGLRLALRAEGAYMAVIFVAEGLLAGGFASGAIAGEGIWFFLACAGFILTNILDQFQMVHSLLMKQLSAERSSELTASLSLGLSVDHIMAVVISPVLGVVWAKLGPAWVFYIAAASVCMQWIVAQWMLPPASAPAAKS